MLSPRSIFCKASHMLNLPVIFGPYGKGNIIVLMYHGITDLASSNPLRDVSGYNMPVHKFQEEMDYLVKYCNVISATDAISKKGLSQTRKNVVITFDDGYKNNFTNAFPMLSKYSLPALFALPSQFIIDRIPLWNDIIEYSVIATDRKSINIAWNNINLNLKINSDNDKKYLINTFLSLSNNLNQEEREAFISHIQNELGVSTDNERLTVDPDYEPMSVRDIKELSSSGLIEFASHSVHHYALSNVTSDTLKKELIVSKSAIEKLSGMPCRYLCIPGGHYNDLVIKESLKVGYKKIFTSDRREFIPEKNVDIIGRNCIFRHTGIHLFSDMVHGPFYRLTTLRQ